MQLEFENMGENEVRIANQAIELLVNYRTEYGDLYLKRADRSNIDFIFKEKKAYEDKSKAERKWLEHLQDLLKAEGVETILYEKGDEAYSIARVEASNRTKKKDEKKRATPAS